MSVRYHEDHWSPPGSAERVWYRIWTPERPQALLVMVHGFGEHGGRYRPLAQALAEQGITVAVPDVRGHGRSDGRPGDLRRIEELLAPLLALTEQVLLPRAGVQRHALFGHSFGGLLAILWAIRHPERLFRLVIQSPLLEVGFPIPFWKRAIAQACLALWPSLQFSMDLDLNNLCHDATVIDAYQRDPLVHHLMSARAYAATLRARAEAVARSGSLRMPVLLLCGEADRIISVPEATAWYNRLAGEKQRVTFPGMYHELHHEPVRDQVLRLIADWVLERPGAAAA